MLNPNHRVRSNNRQICMAHADGSEDISAGVRLLAYARTRSNHTEHSAVLTRANRGRDTQRTPVQHSTAQWHHKRIAPCGLRDSEPSPAYTHPHAQRASYTTDGPLLIHRARYYVSPPQRSHNSLACSFTPPPLSDQSSPESGD